MNKSLTVALAGTLLSASAVVSAATTSSVVTPSLSITSGCLVDASGLNPDMGARTIGYPTSAPVGSLSVLCSDGLDYAFGLGGGANHDVSLGTRMLHESGDGALSYDISYAGTYVGDAGLNGVDASYTESCPEHLAVTGLVGTGSAQSYPLEIVVFAVPGDLPGLYSDLNTLTVVWP